MIGSQFHPEFLSRPQRPHPLFAGFLKASKQFVSTPKNKLTTHRDSDFRVFPHRVSASAPNHNHVRDRRSDDRGVWQACATSVASLRDRNWQIGSPRTFDKQRITGKKIWIEEKQQMVTLMPGGGKSRTANCTDTDFITIFDRFGVLRNHPITASR